MSWRHFSPPGQKRPARPGCLGDIVGQRQAFLWTRSAGDALRLWVMLKTTGGCQALIALAGDPAVTDKMGLL